VVVSANEVKVTANDLLAWNTVTIPDITEDDALTSFTNVF